MVDSFLRYIEFEKRYSRHTLTSYQTDLLQFTKYLEETYQISDPAEANYNLIRSWIITLVENKITPKSINRKIACLRSYYKFLMKKGSIKKDPTLKIKAPKVKKSLPTFVEEENLSKLLDQLEFSDDFKGLRDKLVLELLYGTGVRLSELIELKESDVNRYEKTIKVLGKGNKERIIPINKTLFDLIDIYKEKKKEKSASENLLITDAGEKTYPMFVYRIVKQYLKMVTTVEKKSPHVLRHSFATHLLNKGADLNAIKDLLGHSSLAATQVYTHNSIEKLKEIFNQAHPKSGKQ
ncbi:MAG: tyrosine-type recombinase/integrase [Cytophagaceae bacterium]|nr:tyrosine-type recombinase/integrase [Cytophagaceae bacterium]